MNTALKTHEIHTSNRPVLYLSLFHKEQHEGNAMPHELEKMFNAPAEDIMDAILKGFRAQVDVKGKLAELYLYRYLKEMENRKEIRDLVWEDKDGEPDFIVNYKNKNFKLECKNLRNEIYKKPREAYKVEIQKTRNSKDGTNTRSYRVDYFDVLAVCMFNQTGEWRFSFIKSSDLEVVPDDPNLLKIMQRVPMKIKAPWKKDLLDAIF